MQTMKELLSIFASSGRLEWIGLSSARLATIEPVESATVQAGTGLDGDHHARSGRSKRQVTIIQSEHLTVVGQLLQKTVEPGDVRRNLAVSGINVLALKNERFRIGEVVLEGTGACNPCSRMEQNLGTGGYNAMRGHGGITARVISGGEIRLGDDVVALGPIQATES